MDALKLNVKGIKCDNPKCNYFNKDVSFEDYKDWVNKPCPKCGSNLLTEQDYINTCILLQCTNIVNEKVKNGKLPIPDPNEEMSEVEIKMNGTGKVEFDAGDRRLIVNPNNY